MIGSTSLSFRSLSRLVLGGLILSLAGATGAALLPADPASAATSGSCAGVTVVVDFTELGGETKLGCAASGFDTGLAALHSAGFTSADSQPGLVCTIDAQPDPCPATFQGSFWSYWHGDSGDAEWTNYQVGAATSHPVAGSVEGWRYNDGTAGPGLSPQDAGTQATTPPTDSVQAPAEKSPQKQGSDPVPLIAGGGVVVLLGVVVTVLLLRRRAGRNER